MANNVTVKDGAAANTVFKTTDTAGVHVPHHNIDSMAQLPSTLGAKAASAALGVTLSTENAATLALINTKLDTLIGDNSPVTVLVGQSEYEAVAASSTAVVLGTTGAVGDYICGLLVIPATTSPGAVVLTDNTTAMTVFVGGLQSVSNLVPFFIPLQMTSMAGPWKVTTGTNVSVIATGDFT